MIAPEEAALLHAMRKRLLPAALITASWVLAALAVAVLLRFAL